MWVARYDISPGAFRGYSQGEKTASEDLGVDPNDVSDALSTCCDMSRPFPVIEADLVS